MECQRPFNSPDTNPVLAGRSASLRGLLLLISL